MSVTRDDIARMAGVSSATVSFAFNHPDKVSEEKRRRVLAAAEQVGYAPNRHASVLRAKGSRTVLLLERMRPPARNASYLDIVYAAALRNIKHVLEQEGWHLSLDSIAAADDVPFILQRNPCEGIICFQMDKRPLLDALVAKGIPYVVCHHSSHLKGYNRCYTDEFGGAALAADKLLATGHTHPAHVTGELATAPNCRWRWEGFRSRFQGAAPVLVDGELGVRGGYASAMRLVPLIRKGKVDSIFAHNDLTAIGVANALRQAGLRIPADVSLIGFDHALVIEALPFRLTTVDPGLGETYAEAARLLLRSVRNHTAIDHAVTPILIEGESVAQRLRG
jgi:LacI family transcriptional regulator